MIYVGTDIIEINRIRKNIDLKSRVFLNKIYTLKEIEYCNSKSDPAIHFAGRFAAKEAIKKAILSSDILSQVSLKSIEILSLNGGAPTAEVDLIDNRVSISIAHTKKTAVAMAILSD